MEFINYLIVMYIFMMSPGPSMALISRNSARFGFRHIHFTILGIITSITVYSILAVLGVGALIILYPNAFKIFKTIGSCYIIYLGVKIFLSTFKKAKSETSAKVTEAGRFKQYITGLLTDLANPLSIVGITSIILGFINVNDGILTKFIYLILTIFTAFLYAYSYAFLFGNPISKKFIEPRLFIFERIAGVMVSIVGLVFIYNIITT